MLGERRFIRIKSGSGPLTDLFKESSYVCLKWVFFKRPVALKFRLIVFIIRAKGFKKIISLIRSGADLFEKKKTLVVQFT